MDRSATIDAFCTAKNKEIAITTWKIGNLAGMQPNHIDCSLHDSIFRAKVAGSDKPPDVILFGGALASTQKETDLQPIRAHKDFLAYASKRLRDLFTVEGRIESHQVECNIEAVDHESLRRIVDFVYLGNVSVNAENAVDEMCNVLIGADYLSMNKLAAAFELYLAGGNRVNLENCVKLWCFARKYSCLRVMHATSKFIAGNLIKVTIDAEFLRMPFDDCAKLLLNEAMLAAGAGERCLAAVAWLSYDGTGRAKFVSDIVNMIPLTHDSVSIDTIEKVSKCKLLWEHASHTMQKLNGALKVNGGVNKSGDEPKNFK